MTVHFSPRIEVVRQEIYGGGVIRSDTGELVRDYRFKAILDGTIAWKKSGSPWKFSSQENELAFQAEVEEICRKYPQWPDEFDDEARSDLQRRLQSLVDSYCNSGKIVPEYGLKE